MTTSALQEFLDPILITPYRVALEMTGDSMVAFLFGTAMLCLACVIIGELSMFGAYYLNRRHFAEINREMVAHNNLSLRAITMRDKQSYSACNAVANEYFGKNFFSHIALFASALWPVALMLGWMNYRFFDITFNLPATLPAIGSEVGFTFIAVPSYILMRILFGRVKPYLPPFKQIKAWMKANEDGGEELMSWADIMEKPVGAQEEPAKG